MTKLVISPNPLAFSAVLFFFLSSGPLAPANFLGALRIGYLQSFPQKVVLWYIFAMACSCSMKPKQRGRKESNVLGGAIADTP
jgi:hypothetical protein